MTLTGDPEYWRQQNTSLLKEAEDNAPEGFELVGFLFGENLSKGPLFSKIAFNGRPVYARKGGKGA